MTAGEIVYHLYHKPVDYVRQTLRTGVGKTIAIKQGQKAMMEAAGGLKEIVYADAATYTVYFLTGKKYWYQTAFCLYSLQKYADCNIHAVLVDDGSFDNQLEAAVKKSFPTSTSIIRSMEIQEALDMHLPQSRYPILRKRRLVYPHLRKLTDVHVLSNTKKKLVLDSDMLFFSRPAALIDWFVNSESCIFLKDAVESYGYSQRLMRELTEMNQIRERVNVGIAGINSEKIKWSELEQWTAVLLEREGSSYLQEQALTAMIATKQASIFLDEEKYKVLPENADSKILEVLHHYVGASKYLYFTKCWRQI